MTAKTKKTYKTYLTLSLLLALALAVLRTVAVLRHYDGSLGYFEAGARLPEIANLLTLLAFPLCLSAPFTLGGGRLKSAPPRFHLPTVFSSALLAFLLIAFAALHVTEISAEIVSDAPTDPRAVFTSAVAALLSLLGTVSFVLSASMGAEISAKKAFSSSAVVLFALMYTIFLYFDTDLPINAPEKLLAQMTLLAIALFFLYETRIAIAKPMPAVRVGFGFLAMILSASSAVPNLLYYAANGVAVLETPVHDFLILGFFLYLAARLGSLIPRSASNEAPFFEAALADEEESVSSVGQISFFNDDPAPAPDPGEAAALLSAELSEASCDPESDEARHLFGAPEETAPVRYETEGDLLGQIASDLLAPPDEKEGKQ